ncbi:MAG: hypothetical protein IJ719_06585 [Clostridia bacterium]|nr:hypothetical protein [Clostridia bacterium]
MKDNRLEQRIQHSLNAELSGLNTTSWQRDQFFENATGGTKVKRKLTYSLVLAIVMLLIAATALAAAITNGFGLMDFWKDTRDNVEIPEDAGQYIEHDLAVEETEHFTVRFREALYDGKTCHIVYDVIPRSKELLLFDKPLDEYWYAQTRLNADIEEMLEDGRTILDRWDEGGYTSGWQVDIDVGSDTDTIGETSSRSNGILDEETGIYTGQLDISIGSLKEERTLWFNVWMVPMKDMHDEESMDYDHGEYVHMERTFHAAMSGEEVILVNTTPVLFPSIGVQVDQVRLVVLPQEIQYQIDYSLTDATLYHSIFDDHPDADHTVTLQPEFRFVKATQDGDEPVALSKGITGNFSGYSVDEEKGLYRQTGSLGRSNFSDTYTLCAYRISVPIETVTFQVDVQNPDTFTPEERVWQQKSDRSKPHNEADDTLVDPTSDDLPEAEAVAIAKEAVLRVYKLQDDALERGRVVADMYVTNVRPEYRRWFIQFQVFKEGSDSYVGRVYTCIVDQNGQVISDPDINEPSLEEKAVALERALQREKEKPDYLKKYLEYFDAQADNGGFFWYWPYDVKAAYWQDMQPWINEVPLETDTEVGMTLYYAYGIPDTDELQHDDAVSIARDLIMEKYQIPDAQMSRYYTLCEAFDISGKLYDGNVWKFVFAEFIEAETHDSPNYRVVMDAKTGQAVIIEKFQRTQFRKDRESDLRYY